MSKLPCKQCRECGLYNDFSVSVCKCGADIGGIVPKIIDIAELKDTECGKISEKNSFYIQKCSKCGAESYTFDKDKRVARCYCCNTGRIARSTPVLYEEIVDNETDDIKRENDESPNGKCIVEISEINEYSKAGKKEEIETKENNSIWATSILANVEKEVRNSGITVNSSDDTKKVNDKEYDNVSTKTNEVADDDDEEIRGWGHLKKQLELKRDVTDNGKKTITLTATGYGSLIFTVTAGDTPYLLGRDANQKEFLEQDGRVGNEHCYLIYRNDTWYVRDNHSTNGTMVDSCDIGKNGECVLRDGSELKLGHRPDSMAFLVSIR